MLRPSLVDRTSLLSKQDSWSNGLRLSSCNLYPCPHTVYLVNPNPEEPIEIRVGEPAAVPNVSRYREAD